MKYKAIIWDLDGTLLDTSDDLTDALNQAMAAIGRAPHTNAEVRSYFGSGVRRAIELAAPGADEAQRERAYKVFCDYYAVHCNDKTGPYAGIPELLDRLAAAGVKMAIVSNKEDFAVRTLAQRYFGKWIVTAVGARAGIRLKPAPDTVLAALDELGVAAADALYVGDSDVDVLTAANSGMDCVSVTWGFRTEAFLLEKGAKRIVREPEGLFEAAEM